MITALFWVVTQQVVVISYRRFGTTYRSVAAYQPKREQFQSISGRKPEITLIP